MSKEYKRPSKDEYYWNIAREVAGRATCLIAKFGAVIVNNDVIISTGYVGAPRGTKSCIERGYCIRRRDGIPSGTNYERCASVHAEMNAMLHASRTDMIGGTMYLFGAKRIDGEDIMVDSLPCLICKKMILNSGVSKFVSNKSSGNLEVFDVEEWRREWSERDFLDDKRKYSVDHTTK
jgi:dCMP deaminase